MDGVTAKAMNTVIHGLIEAGTIIVDGSLQNKLLKNICLNTLQGVDKAVGDALVMNSVRNLTTNVPRPQDPSELEIVDQPALTSPKVMEDAGNEQIPRNEAEEIEQNYEEMYGVSQQPKKW